MALTTDPELARLHEELRAYPCDQPEVEVPGPGGHLDITVAELVIESFFPADARTAAILRRGSGD